MIRIDMTRQESYGEHQTAEERRETLNGEQRERFGLASPEQEAKALTKVLRDLGETTEGG